ncbi:MAG: enoyl-CoA hydratase/isomerase family protein [Phycisphaerae bacterium]
MIKTQIRIEKKGSLAEITFATEDGLNVLSPDVLHTFGAAVANIKQDVRIRTTVIRAEGRVFVAGADAKVLTTSSADQARDYATLGQDVFAMLASLPSISVAAINGAALGGGLELALACDFRIAVKFARLGLPEVSLGITPAWGGIARLTKLIGPSRAKRLYLSAARVSAEEGARYGLVDELVNSVEDLGPRVAAFCRLFHKAAPTAVALAKRASRDMDDVSAFADCFHTTESREGVAAFLEKRAASWMEETNS